MAGSWWSNKTLSAARPLRTWLALRIVLAGVLPLVVVAALVLWILSPQLRADLETLHQTLARALAGQIEAHLLGAGRELRALATDLRDQDPQDPQLAALWTNRLDAHAGTGDVFAAIYITDADDSVQAVGLPQAQRNQRGDLLGLDLSGRLMARGARAWNQGEWSETFLSAVTGRLAVTLAIPVADRMLIGEIAIDRLSDFIGRLPVEAGMLTVILDRRGQIIAHSQAALSGQQLSLGHLPIVRDALRGQLAPRDFDWDGETFVGAPVSVPQVGWIVLVAQPHGEALRPLLSTLGVLAAGALAALLLALVVALALARDFARRIDCYAEQAHAIAEGDYDQPRPVSMIREFDHLGSDLERMARAIRQREQDLATSEARYRSVIGNAPVVLFQFDERGIFTFSEGKGLARVGLVAGEAVGQSLFELYRDYPEVCEHARRALGGAGLQFVSWVGETCFDIYFNPVRDGDGRIQVMGVSVDITDRKRAEEALRRSNRQLRMLSDCNQALIRITDEMELLTTICTITVREGGYRMAWVGYAEQDASKTIRPMAHAGFEEGYLQNLNITWADDERGLGPMGAAIRTERPCLVRHIASDSRFAPWRAEAAKRGYAAVCALPLAASDQIFGALGIYSSAPDAFDAEEIDLLNELASNLAFGIAVLRTRIEHERAEMALKEKTEELDRFFTVALDLLCIADTDGYFHRLNPQWEVVLGYSLSELKKERFLDLVHPDDQASTLAALGELGTQKVVLNFVNRYRRKDGSYCWIEWKSYPIGNLVYAAARDITDRKQAEEALRLTQFSVDCASDSIVWVDDEGKLIYVNDAACASMGYGREELLSMKVFDIDPDFPPDGFEEHKAELRRLGSMKFESRHRTKDGRLFPVEVTTNYFEYNGRFHGFAFDRDITERKRAEAELQRHRERLEELVAERTAELRQAMNQLVQSEKLAALGHLVAGVAHELNTPLGNARVIAGALGAHLREFAAAVDAGALRRSQVDAFLERGREAVDLLERNAARAADLIGHFKQVAVDQASARRRRFNLRRTVEELLATLQPQIKRTAHRIELEIPPDLELDSYPGPLEQVIANLLSNSLIHGFAGIEAGRIQLQVQTVDSTQIILRYADNGTGIPAAILGRIFDPFFTTSMGQGGSGLGLYIVYNLVTGVLGGTIQVHGPSDHGTAFTLVLPIIAPDTRTRATGEITP